jgi:2-polyprenyl-3-methyl-5-hydroxy-6-metoxy-1,4-benzoquinol methylase
MRIRIIYVYAQIRFHILRLRFLEEIGQYLPTEGAIVDIGCGFGLFSLFFANQERRRHISGFDLNARRIETARRSAARLGLDNVAFEIGDASQKRLSAPVDAVYMLDIVHHIPPESVVPLIENIARNLRPGGVLLIKDVADRPAYKRWFTWALDKAMDCRAPVTYWPVEALKGLLAPHFTTIHVHSMVDYLPYPHVLYICRR